MIYRRARQPAACGARRRGLARTALALAAVRADRRSPGRAGAPSLVAVVGAAVAAAGGRGSSRRAALLTAPFALAIALINPLVTRDGLTVIARGGQVPVARAARHHARGHRLRRRCSALRAVALVFAGALYASAVDPDEVLRLFRRVSFRSALTAALATRMVPVLARDAGRLAEAQRCRPGGRRRGWPSCARSATGALDRAIDVAATLEVRGYGTARRAPARRAAMVAPRPRLRGRGRRARGRSPSPAARRARRTSRPTRASRPAAARDWSGSRWRCGRLRARAVHRPPGDRPMTAMSRSSGVTLSLPGRRRARAARRHARDRARASSSLLAGASGSGQVHAAARSRAGWCRTSTAASFAGAPRWPAWTPASTGPANWPRTSARCSRTPRRRS